MAGNGLTDDGFGGLITNSYSTAAVSGRAQVGGLAGSNANGSRIVASYAAGDVTGSGQVGGLAGYNLGAIKDSFATGNVTGGASDFNAGGLVGSSWGSIVASYATGNVEGNQYVGGLVGRSSARVGETWLIASYSTGNVSGQIGVGGLAGILSSQEEGVSNVVASYSTSRVSGSTTTGGLLGENGGGTVSNSYWNTQTSGQTESVGYGASTGIEGKTTTELQQPTGYTGIYGNWNIDLDNVDGDDDTTTGVDDFWDFGIDSQYPALKVDFNNDGTPTWEEFGDQRSDTGTTPVTDSASDREALVALYNATGGENWLNSDNWLSSQPIGQWHGVSTDDNGRATMLLLGGNQLSGEIPAELSNLSNLTGLFLGNNRLSGVIPAELGNLSNLESLFLFSNQLSGVIPAELGNLSNLIELELSRNQLSGQIPAELGNLTNLESLFLGSNQLTGCIPSSLQDVGINDFDDVGLPFCDGTPGPGADDCAQTLTADGAFPGAWAPGCDSEDRPGRHAQFYTFTLGESGEVTITLESGDADTSLYLREGSARTGTSLHENDDHEGAGLSRSTDSQIRETLPAGAYTIEATTFGEGETGSFSLTVAGLAAGTTDPDPGADDCAQTLTADGSFPGAWAPGCDSEDRPGRHAQFYTFTLGESGEVTITLESGDADTSLYLREGDARTGTSLHENDDHEGAGLSRSTDSQIRESLPAGAYTIEATTFGEGETGSFSLTVAGLAAGTTDPGSGADDCAQTLTADGAFPGAWAPGCDSEDRPGRHAQFYTFTLGEPGEVTITLESGDADTSLYLREGDARTGTSLHENDDHEGAGLTRSTDSQIRESLPAGAYTIEATTFGEGETGSFTLTVAGLAAGDTTDPDPGADDCAQTLTADGSFPGAWAPGCDSEDRPGRHAQFYTFTLGEPGEVTITLESGDADTSLYLREGSARTGTSLHENDDHEGAGLTRSTDSQIRETLPAGAYTIEATTFGEGETGSFTLTVAGLAAGDTTDPGPGADDCAQTLTADGAFPGAWAPGCDSEDRPGRHAQFYTFTLGESGEVTITLESGDADTSLYLREGSARTGTSLHENDDHEGAGLSRSTDSQIRETLPAGAYTIEATTFGEGETGSFSLTVAGLAAGTTDPDPGADDCAQTLTADGSFPGAWAPGCDSEDRPGRHAQFYTFTLGESGEVTITLESGDADTSLYLREGDARTGTSLHENDDHEGAGLSRSTDSQIRESLPAGAYTIEATTFGEGETGSFTLTVAGLAAGTTDPGPGTTDRAALVALYNATDGGNWANNFGWLSDAPLEEWYGVTTDSDGRVTSIDLRENSLTGQIPGSLGELESLRNLYLSNADGICGDGCEPSSPTANRLPGPIPSELSNLASLTDLRLAFLQLSGPVPTWMGDLTNLQIVDLVANELSGNIPEQLGNLSKLTSLALGHNQLTGTMPDSIGNLTGLQSLTLHDNRLTGSIPSSYGDLSDLEVVFLFSGNDLTGCIPAGLREVPRNDFFGQLPYCGETSEPDPSTLYRAALVALYNATDGANWRDNSG